MTNLTEFEKTCFVIMPFSKKRVGNKTVDFDAIYDKVFAPAIAEAVLPEGGKLEPKRTDVDTFSSSISQDMFEYIMYSRVAFTDISGFNPNVFYELGVRHGAQESGTIIFRQPDIAIPFDINAIKVFEYNHGSKKKIDASKALITTVLSESLKRNRLDSPVRLALRAQRKETSEQGEEVTGEAANGDGLRPAKASDTGVLDALLREAEEALRSSDLETARALYGIVLRIDPANVVSRMRLGLILKRQARHFDALEQFSYLTQQVPDYGEAWREKGVVESLVYRLVPADKRPGWLPSGEESLRRATTLNPEDFDAWASWGGIVRRKPDNSGALEKYRRSAQVSNGHPYPLLNVIKLEAATSGKIDLQNKQEQLSAAEEMRRGQTLSDPPTDTPWCYFDLAEIKLYQGDEDAFLQYLKAGVECSTEKWQIKTFHDGLQTTLIDNKIDLPGLKQGIKILSQAMRRK